MASDDFSAEEWRDIPGFDQYQISNCGRVRTKPRILKPWFNNTTGYFYIGLGRKYRGTIHRLVCLVFHGAPTAPQLDVAHNDGCRTNNRADNLRWATRSE